ncbi:MAG TPA: CoA transferase [Pseudonocardiaceae bacterium]|nr:CoA transferase [Pseudonocardiaceae bacterium]
MTTANDVFRALYQEIAGRGPEPDEAEILGADPALPGEFLVGPAAAACVATTTLSAAELLQARGTKPGQVTVDGRHAALAFGSERWLRVGDRPPADVWAELSGDYRAADGWVRLHCNYPQHARAACRALSVPADRAAVAAAVSLRPAIEIEEGVLAAGGVAAAMRTSAEWRKHPAGRAASTAPLLTLDSLPAPARSLSLADRPLSGIRVLELTHVLAGPVCGRTLAAHGADVLHVGAAHLPTVGQLVMDTGFGKRSTHLDLRTETDTATLRGLVADADVFVQSFRPGTLAARGLGFAELAGMRPGIVVVELSAYGHTGPWRSRRGFDSLVQMAGGIADDGAKAAGADRPVPLPCQALDHATGWLAAAAVCTALRRQSADGGSWLVRLSLARVATWLADLGRQPAPGGDPMTPTELLSADSPFGRLTYLPIPGHLPAAPPTYDHAPHLPGSDPAVW